MNNLQVQAVFGLRPLRPYLAKERLAATTVEVLVAATFNRAVLLPEITHSVLISHLKVPQSEVALIAGISADITVDCEGEMSVKFRYLPVVFARNPRASIHANVVALRPATWSWLELLAAGVPLTSPQLASSLHGIYDENKWVEETNKIFLTKADGWRLSTFAERCRQSGCSQMIPTAIHSTAPTSTHQRHDRGPPRKRIAAGREPPSTTIVGTWRFVGHLESEVSLRVRLGTVPGSWKTLESQLRAWGAYMDSYHPFVPHFPVILPRLAAYLSFFDNADSGRKYFGALHKASEVMDMEWPKSRDIAALMKGAAKFQTPARRSFLVGMQTGVIVNELLRLKHVELAKFVVVCYTYQLRAQSEGFPMQSGVRQLDVAGDHWHSDIVVKPKTVAIVLRRRKNKDKPSEIIRYCICDVWIPQGFILCGPCTLRKLVSERPVRCDRLFQGIKATDINVIKKIALDKGLGPATWHGFRRGRTMDVVAGLDVKENPSESMKAIFESGGWNIGSRAIFQYITPEAANHKRVAQHLADDSQSES